MTTKIYKLDNLIESARIFKLTEDEVLVHLVKETI